MSYQASTPGLLHIGVFFQPLILLFKHIIFLEKRKYTLKFPFGIFLALKKTTDYIIFKFYIISNALAINLILVMHACIVLKPCFVKLM